MEGWWQQLNSLIYDHRNGIKVVPSQVVKDIQEVLSSISPELEKNTVKSLKNDIWNKMVINGWSGEYRIDSDSQITISSYLQGVGLCFQTGNAGRIYADLLKLQALYVKGKIIAGIIIVPGLEIAKILGSNLANYDRLVRELPLFSQVITMPIVVIGFEVETEK